MEYELSMSMKLALAGEQSGRDLRGNYIYIYMTIIDSPSLDTSTPLKIIQNQFNESLIIYLLSIFWTTSLIFQPPDLRGKHLHLHFT